MSAQVQDPRPSSDDQTLPPSPDLKPSPSSDSIHGEKNSHASPIQPAPRMVSSAEILTGKKLAVVFVAMWVFFELLQIN